MPTSRSVCSSSVRAAGRRDEVDAERAENEHLDKMREAQRLRVRKHMEELNL